MFDNDESDWQSRAFKGIVLVLAIAFVSHIAWQLLRPMLPLLFGLLTIGAFYAVYIRRKF